MEQYLPSEGLRILMLAPQPWFQPRGTPFSVLHRIKALSLLGHRVDLVTYHVGQDVAIDGLTIVRARRLPFIRNVKIGPSLPKVFLDAALYLRARELLRKNRYDFIHTHEEAAFFGIDLAKKYRIPHLYDMHSSLPQQLQNFRFSRSRLLAGIFERLERRAIEESAAVITICPELQSYVESRFPHKVSILIENVADNSIVFPPTPAQTDELRRQYGLDGKRVVLYYGTLEPYQGIDLLLESAALIPKSENIRFLIVGGREEQVRAFRRRAEELGAGDRVIFAGFVQPQLIPSFVEVSDILVSPRLQGSNSPLKLYSYLRSGRAIVATRHITHTQILNDSTAVLAEPRPNEFAAAIRETLGDEERRRRLARAAKQLAEAQYSYEDYLHKTRWIVEQVMRSRR